MQKFGFSQYESQVYQTLMNEEQALEASLISKLSGVPKAKVYEVISRLIEKGVLLDSMLEKKKMYRAIPLEQLIQKLTLQFQDELEQLKEVKQKKAEPDDRVWNLATEDSIYVYSQALIESAQNTIYISAWKEIIVTYLSILERKEKEGVHVEVHVVGEMESNLKHVKYFVPTENQKELKKFQNIVVDDTDVIFAIAKEPAWHSIVTQSEQLVDVFRDFFYRDLIITLLSEKYDELLQQDHEYVELITKLRY